MLLTLPEGQHEGSPTLTVRLHIENNLVVCTWGSNMTHTKSLFSRSVLIV